MPAVETSPAPPEKQFVQSLGLLDSTMLVAGSMIGSGIFIVSADMARHVGSPPAGCWSAWLRHRRADRGGRPVLRRAGRHDAARRRPVRLPPRGVSARSGASSTAGPCSSSSRPAPSRPSPSPSPRYLGVLVAGHLADCLAHSRRSDLSAELRCQPVDGAAGRRPADRAADRHQHARHRVRQAGSRTSSPSTKTRRPARADRHRPAAGRATPTAVRAQLRRPLDAARPRTPSAGRPASRPFRRRRRVRPVRRLLCGADRLALLLRRLEQHHLHRRRGEATRAATSRSRWRWAPAS